MRAALAAVLLVAGLAVPAAAGARIVPQRGMKGLRLDMTVAQVRDRLGAPDKVGFTRDPIIGRTRVYRYGAVRVTFNGAASDARVITLSTTGRAERTAAGIGVGSTRAAVARLVRGVRCRVEFGVDHCVVGRQAPGRVVTDFRIARGRVSAVIVGRVVD